MKLGWKKQLYIATKQSVLTNEYGNDEIIYNRPINYMFNYQPANGDTEIALYGEKVTAMYKAVIPYKLYNGKFKEGDVAYLNQATPKGETKYGNNANYTIISVMPQNKAIILYFEKIIK